MALVKDLVNLGSCGVGNSLGMNVSLGCKQRIVAAQTIGAFTPGAFMDPNQELTEAYFLQLMEEGKIDLATNVTSFEENGSDDAIETLEDDTQIVTNEGKYKFMATFTSGLYLNRALHSLKGFGSRDIFIIDKEGSIILTKRNAGGVKGFTTGMIQPGKLQFPSNTVGQKESLMFQFLNRFEMDDNYVIIEKENLDFDPRIINGVSQVTLSYVNDPTAADTTITFEAVLTQDNKTPLEGLESNDIEFAVNGTVQSITPAPVVGFPGRYTATVTALASAENTSLRLHNTTDSRTIINKDGSLYKSLTLTKLVA
ncbi:hypothetical protein [Aquimarina sp. AU119]|uniref:hypothetical protein n=1 Tax=Aquimarina sp. AU119 TaxID=2108528 RepID=UPI000D69F8F9|nr:hypothetical protein [Aquimarina sp. AU119]